ncbi:MAG: HD domain-containing phosphohydrolase [Pseudomonadota bacterium]
MDVNEKSTVLIVDGGAGGAQAEKLLAERYNIKVATGGEEALALVHQVPRPDLVLLDAALPDMDSHSLCRDLKTNFLTASIPVLVMVARVKDGPSALRDGAADFLVAGGDPITLLARVATQLELRAARSQVKEQNARLEMLVSRRIRDAVQMQDATVMAMAALAEARDENVGNHIRRTQLYVGALARELRFHPRFASELDDENIALMAKAAPLHDIGKVAVPDAILFKPDRLTDDEFATMKMHTVYGRDAILGVEKTLGMSTPFLRYAREITFSHQEKWDGSGYPEGLAGEAIPLAARLMAVADVYDALISTRLYRPAFTHETAVELIRQGRGEHFDPDVVDAMLVVEEKFLAIAAQFPDH